MSSQEYLAMKIRQKYNVEKERQPNRNVTSIESTQYKHEISVSKNMILIPNRVHK